MLKQLNYPVVTITILIWLCCSKVYCQSSLIFIVSLKTIVDHCPQNFEKHRKTIGLMVGPPIVVVYQESRPWRRQPSEMQCRFTKKLDFSPDKPSRQRLRANNAGSYTFGNAGNAFQIENPPDGRRLYSYLFSGRNHPLKNSPFSVNL